MKIKYALARVIKPKVNKETNTFVCFKCRIWIKLNGMTDTEQEEYATESAFQ